MSIYPDNYQWAAALDGVGQIHCWGSNLYGTVSGAPPGTGYQSVAAGSNFGLALTLNGSIIGWGKDYKGQVSGIPTGAGYKEVYAANETAAALRADGSLVVWGEDTGGVVSGAPKSGYFLDVALGAVAASALLDNDCNGNGTPDSLDLESGASADCNGNGVPDECDLAGGYSTDLDSDGQLDDCVSPPLNADLFELSVATGGVQTFSLTAPVPSGLYLILGTTSGTSPGIPSGAMTVPLNYDNYLLHTAVAPNTPPLSGSLGFLTPSGGQGLATATFTLPPSIDPALVGLTLHHAYVTIGLLSGQLTSVSNPVPSELLP